MYSLDHSDCVVFSEHMYAMALSRTWREFFAYLQRIRYANGEIGMLTRNHYTIADWDRNNAWLVEDITEELAGEDAVHTSMVVNRANFFKKFGIGQDVPVEHVDWAYVPYEIVPRIMSRLQPGDFVNIIRGYESGKWAGHVGLITRDANGATNFLHSTHPRVKEQPLMELVETAEAYNAERWAHNEMVPRENERIRVHNAEVDAKGRGKKKDLLKTKPYFYGFKFLRLRENPLEALKEIDGPDAPVVTIKAKY